MVYSHVYVGLCLKVLDIYKCDGNLFYKLGASECVSNWEWIDVSKGDYNTEWIDALEFDRHKWQVLSSYHSLCHELST